MASIRKRRNKRGELVYNIRVYSGKDERGRYNNPFATTFHPEPGWTEEKADKEAEKFAAIFEHDCKKSGVTNSAITFQEYAEQVKFRHTVASILIYRGYDVVTVSKYLGHESPEVTSRIYAHFFQEALAKASDAIGEILLE